MACDFIRTPHPWKYNSRRTRRMGRPHFEKHETASEQLTRIRAAQECRSLSVQTRPVMIASSQPCISMLGHKGVVIQVRVEPVNPVNLLHLPRRQFFLGIQAPATFQKPL